MNNWKRDADYRAIFYSRPPDKFTEGTLVLVYIPIRKRKKLSDKLDSC